MPPHRVPPIRQQPLRNPLPEDIPGYQDFLAKKEQFTAAAGLIGGSGASGSYMALLITASVLAVVSIVWLTWRFLQHHRQHRDGHDASKRKEKASAKRSVAENIANALLRAKAVAVWLKAIRYVRLGLTDDHFFKVLMMQNSQAGAGNPFVVHDERSRDATDEDREHSVEQNLVIIIGVDGPHLLSKENDAEQTRPPMQSVHADCERVAAMFQQCSYFGCRYKTVTLTSKSVVPSSKNLAQLMQQLAESHRVWSNIAVYLSATVRPVPKDFIDSSLLRQEYTDLTKVKHFAKGRGTQSTSSASLGVYGTVGLEFLAECDRADDPAAWVDVGLLLDRLRLVTRRHEDDAPIVCLFDVTFLNIQDGVREALSWMQVASMPVHFKDGESLRPARNKKIQSNAETSQGEDDPLDSLLVTREELQLFAPHPDLLEAIDRMAIDDVVAHALRDFDHLAVCGLMFPDRSMRSEDMRDTTLAQRQRHVSMRAAQNGAVDAAASLWTAALLDAFHTASTSCSVVSLLEHSAAAMWMGQSSDSQLLHTSPLPASKTTTRNASSSATVSGTNSSSASVFHGGLMSLDSIQLYLQHTAPSLAAAVATLSFHKCNKNRTVPLMDVPLATQVSMMPRPLHCRPLVLNAPFSMSQSSLATERQLVALFQARAVVSSESRADPSPVAAIPPRAHDGLWVLHGAQHCGKSHFVRHLCWNADVLQVFQNNVLYVDLRDFEGDDLEEWFVDVVGYLCRLSCNAAQVSTIAEAIDVFRWVFYHSDARYLIVLDHCRHKQREFVSSRVLSVPSTTSAYSGSLTVAVQDIAHMTPDDDVFALSVAVTSVESVVEAALTSCGAHRASESVTNIARGIVDRCVRNVVEETQKTALQVDWDVLPLLRRLARNTVSQLLCGKHPEVQPVGSDWGSRELVETAINNIFAASTGSPSPLGSVNKHHDNNNISKLKVLQSILYAKRLFLGMPQSSLSMSTAATDRIPMHWVRYVAVLYHRLSLSSFIHAVDELVASGVLLRESTSYASCGTVRSTLLEDAHASMMDTSVTIRLNTFLTSSPEFLDFLEAVDACDMTLAASESAFAASCDALRLHVRQSVAAHRNEDKMRCGVLTALLPFVATPATTVSSHVCAEVLQLAAGLRASQLLLAGGVESDEFPAVLCSAVTSTLTHPWFLSRVLDVKSARQLLLLLQRMHLALHGAAGVVSTDRSATLLRAASQRVEEVVTILSSIRVAIHRNPFELMTHMTLRSTFFKAEDTIANDVLAVEPRHGGTAVLPDAYDGSTLIVTKLFKLHSLDQDVLLDSDVSCVTFVAPGLLAVGTQNGAIIVLSLGPTCTAGAVEVLSRVLTADTKHEGGAITDFYVYLRVEKGESQGKLVLVSSSRANKIARQWDDVCVLHKSEALVPATLDDGVRLQRVYFPCSARVTSADVLHQVQLEEKDLHRFFAKIVVPVTSGAAFAEVHLGKGKEPAHPITTLEPFRPRAVLLLRYGLPDMYRGGVFSETTSNCDVNPLHMSHASGITAAAASVTVPELDSASCACCGVLAEGKGHLVTAVGCGKTLWLLELQKEVS